MKTTSRCFCQRQIVVGAKKTAAPQYGMPDKKPQTPKNPKNDAFRPEWSKRLEAARTLTGMNAAEFARSIKMSQQRYNHYEKGLREPDIQAWIFITRALGVSVSRIFYGSDSIVEMPAPAPMQLARPSRR